MDVLRTPDERFADLSDYPFVPHYVKCRRAIRAQFGSITSMRARRTDRWC